MIQYLKGSAVYPQVDGPLILAHIVNDRGAWGKGFVLAISRRWEAPEHAYRDACRKAEGRLGAIQLVPVQPDFWVCNLWAQEGFSTKLKPAVRYDSLRVCLTSLRPLVEQHQASVVMPRIGCGLAGGSWEVVEPLVQEALTGLPVYVYDPLI